VEGLERLLAAAHLDESRAAKRVHPGVRRPVRRAFFEDGRRGGIVFPVEVDGAEVIEGGLISLVEVEGFLEEPGCCR
jgi:hypothetical protein